MELREWVYEMVGFFYQLAVGTFEPKVRIGGWGGGGGWKCTKVRGQDKYK